MFSGPGPSYVSSYVVSQSADPIQGCSPRRAGGYLFDKGQDLFSGPSGRLPRIPVRALRSAVHHHVDGRAAAKNIGGGNHDLAAANALRSIALVEGSGFGSRAQVGQEERGVVDDWVAGAVGARLDD